MKKILITIVATVLVCACAIGGTTAWLMDKTETVTNTFTIGDINITLTETATDGNTKLDATTSAQTSEYVVVPGKEYAKDPTVTVLNGSEACWLFVKIEETNNLYNSSTTKYMTYTVAEGWNITATDGVYYREVGATDTDAKYPVLAGNKVTMNSAITKTMIDALGGNKPSIVISAYAVQKDAAGNAADAWTLAQNPDNY